MSERLRTARSFGVNFIQKISRLGQEVLRDLVRQLPVVVAPVAEPPPALVEPKAEHELGAEGQFQARAADSGQETWVFLRPDAETAADTPL